MAFRRRGYVPDGINPDAAILLHRIDGSASIRKAGSISCFEEHSIKDTDRLFVTVYLFTEAITVQDTFEEFTALLAAEVPSNV